MDFHDFYSLFSAEFWSKKGRVPERITQELSAFDKHENILEVGTAEAYIIRRLVLDKVVKTATGYDISKRRIAKAKERVAKEHLSKKIKIVLGDGQHLPFADKSFDVVLLPQILEHVPTRQGVISLLKESKRVSRYGLLVSLPLTDVDRMQSRYLDPDHLRNQIVNKNGWIYNPKNVEELFAQAGFKILRSTSNREFYILK